MPNILQRMPELRRKAAITGLLSVIFLLSTPDIFGMLAWRNPSFRWVNDLAPLFLIVGAVARITTVKLQQPDLFRATFLRSRVVLATVGLSFLSLVWSLDRNQTGLSLTWLVTQTAVGLAVSTVRPLRLVVDGFAGFAIATIALGALISVSSERFQMFGAWLGFFGNRNGFGAFVAIAIPAICVASRGNRLRNQIGMLAVPFCLFCQFRIRSATATAASIVALAVFLVPSFARIAKPIRSRAKTLLPKNLSLAITLILATAVVAALSELVRVTDLSFDFTFSQRASMWKSLFIVGGREAWRGFGYGAFWSGNHGFLGQAQVRSGTGLELVTGHNSVIHSFIDLGAVGAVLTISTIVLAIHRGRRLWGSTPGRTGDFVLLTALALTIEGSMEAMFAGPRGICWTMWVLIIAMPTTGESPIRERSVVGRKGAALLAANALFLSALAGAKPVGYPHSFRLTGAIKVLEVGGAFASPRRSLAVNRLLVTMDARRDLREAFAPSGVVDVRALLEWSVTSSDSDALALSVFRPSYLGLIRQFDQGAGS